MKRTLIAILLAAFLLAGCGSAGLSVKQEPAVGYYDESYGMGGGAPSYPAADMLPAPTMMAAVSMEEYSRAAVDGTTAANVEAAARERMVVKNAELAIVVKDPEVSMASISALAEKMGGFVVSSNLYQSYAPSGAMVPEASVVIRVPADKLTEAMKTIKADAIEVQTENISGQDVTSQYVDLESQLKNLEAAEEQLMAIMKEATDTEDVLNVFNQLTSIRGQIESIKGQMQYFEESAALSAVTVRLVAEETIEPIEIAGWKPEGTLRDAVQNLIYFWQDFVDFLIVFVVNVLPILITIGVVFGLPIWLIARAIRKASRKRKAREQMPVVEKK